MELKKHNIRLNDPWVVPIIFFIGLFLFSAGISISGGFGTSMLVFGVGTMIFSLIVGLNNKGAFS